MVIREKDFYPDYKAKEERRAQAMEAKEQLSEIGFTVEEVVNSIGNPFADGLNIASNCCMCGEKITIPCVYWFMGGGIELTMHSKCAENLAFGLLNDVKNFNSDERQR